MFRLIVCIAVAILVVEARKKKGGGGGESSSDAKEAVDRVLKKNPIIDG